MILPISIGHRFEQHFLEGKKSVKEPLPFFLLYSPFLQFEIYHRKICLAKSIALTFWGGAISICVIVLCIMGNLVLQRSNNTPTLTTIETYYHRIHDVPFPAITFCNLNVIHRSSLQPIVKQL